MAIFVFINIFSKTYWLNFNAIIKQKSICVGGLIFGCVLALKSDYIFFLHVCFARIGICKGRFAPLASRGMFTYLFGSVSHILVVNVQGVQGGRHSRPPAPLGPSPLKMWKKTEPNKWVNIPRDCKNMKTKRLGMKAINATHTQARTIIT